MRFSLPPAPAVIAGFVAVLVGYASSAAIIWQAAAAAGATPAQTAGWMTMLGIGMGVSTLALSLWYRAPVLTAWSTPGAALLATGLAGSNLHEAVGIFIFASALIVICGATGLFARLMKIIPLARRRDAGGHSAALRATGVRHAGRAFYSVRRHDGAWLLCKVFAPRYAVVAVLLTGVAVCLLQGEVNTAALHFRLAPPEFVSPAFSLSSLLGVGLPFFLVTMASQNAPCVATLQASGYRVPVSPLMVTTGLLALLLAPFGVFSICIAAITAAICQSPEAHPDRDRRWIAAAMAGVFYLLAGVFGGSVGALMTALPLPWLQTLAGLALLGTIGGSLHQALANERTRDAALITFLMTASGVTLLGVGSAFWGLMAGGISYALLARRAG